MEKHTPGPWKFEIFPSPFEANRYRVTGTITQDGEAGFGPKKYFPHICDTQYGDAEANARLIAVAPELLEALKLALSIVQPSDEIHAEITMMQQAIAKAENN